VRQVAGLGYFFPWGLPRLFRRARTPARSEVPSDGTGAIEYFTIGLRERVSRLTFEKMPQLRQTVIYAGLAPYFAFGVLYDRKRGGIGMRPGPPPPGASGGQLVLSD
jgi:hypothetical protein